MSGIYIPGMEMPKSCRYCEFRHMSLTQNAFCTAAHETIDYMAERTKRLDNCPLIPVPDHGRLIDADALAEDLDFDVENDQRALDQMDFVGKEREHIQFDKDCKQNCMWYLSEAPTIIPASKEEEG